MVDGLIRVTVVFKSDEDEPLNMHFNSDKTLAWVSEYIQSRYDDVLYIAFN